MIGSAIQVHRALGPGLLESAYRACLIIELQRAGLEFVIEKSVPLVYNGIEVGCGYRLDLVVEDAVVVEMKAVSELLPIHVAQVLTYLRITGYPVALLLNFNAVVLVEGLHRLINPRPAPRYLAP